MIVGPDEHQTLGWCGARRGGAIAGPQGLPHLDGTASTPSDLDEHADQAAHHLVGEGVGADVELHRGAGAALRSVPDNGESE